MKKILIFVIVFCALLSTNFQAAALCTDSPNLPNNGWCTLDHEGNFICQSFGGCSCTCDGNSGTIDPPGGF